MSSSVKRLPLAFLVPVSRSLPAPHGRPSSGSGRAEGSSRGSWSLGYTAVWLCHCPIKRQSGYTCPLTRGPTALTTRM